MLQITGSIYQEAYGGYMHRLGPCMLFSTYFCLSISICRSTSVCFRLDEEPAATPLSLSASEPDVVDASELEERCLRLRCLRPRWRSRSLRSLRLS